MAGQRDVSFTIKAVDAATSTVKRIRGELADLRKSFFNVGGALTAAAAGVTLGTIFKGAVEQFAEAQAGILRLGKAIENTGGNFQALRPEIDATLAHLAKITTFKDDDLVAGLEQLTIVSGDAKGSVAALGLAADIAKQKKMSLADAATVVGKVMVGETSMLKRYGIVVKDGADAMAELQKRFGGFAATEAQSVRGALDRISNGWEQFLQALGKAMFSGERAGGVLGMVAGKLADLEKWVGQNEETIATLTNAVAVLAGFLLDVLGGAVRYAIIGVKTLGLGLDTVGALFTNMALAGKIALGELMKSFGEWLEASAGFFDKFGISVDGLGDKLANLGNKWRNSGLAAQRENRSVLWSQWGALGDYVNGAPAAPPAPAPTAPTGKLPGQGVNAADVKAIDTLRDSLRALLATSVDGETKAESFARKIAKWTEEARKSKMGADEQARALAQLNAVLAQIKLDEQTAAFRDLEAAMLEATGDVVQRATADLGKKLDDLRKKAHGVTDPQEAARYRQELAKLSGMYDAQIRALGNVEESKRRLKALDEWLITHPPFAMSSADLDAWGQQLEDEIQRLQAALADPELTDGARKALEDQLEKARGEMDKWGDAVAAQVHRIAEGWRDAANAAQEYRDRVGAALETTAALARGIIAAASAMGQLDAKTQAIANDVANLADSAGKLIASGGTDVGAWVQTIGSLADLGSKLFTGETPQEKAARVKVLHENTAALRQLTAKVGLLGTTASGSDVGRAASILNNPSIIWGSAKSKVNGFSADDWALLNSVAKALGLTLDGTVGSLKQLRDALGTVSGHLAQFDNSFAGQTAFAEQFNRLFGKTGLDALQNLMAPARDRSPAVAGLFAGLDINSAEGQKALRERAQDLFLRMAPGSLNPLGAADLGGLSGSDLATIIQQIIDALNALDDAAPAAATALETLNAALRAVDIEAEVYGKDSADVLRDKVAAYGKVFPELAGILDGLDLGKADDVATLRDRLRDLFKAADDGTLKLPDGTKFDDLAQAILALLGVTDKVAGGIETAAQRMNAAASSLRTDFEVFQTGGEDQATQLAKLYGFDIGNLSTADGRQGAIAKLQGIYTANKGNADVVAQVLEVLRAVRGLPELPAMAGLGGDGAALEPVPQDNVKVSGGLASASYVQVDTLMTYSKLSSDYLRDIRDWLLGGGGLGAGGPVTLSVGAINVDARGSNDAGAVEVAGRRGVDAALAVVRLNLRAAAGTPRV